MRLAAAIATAAVALTCACGTSTGNGAGGGAAPAPAGVAHPRVAPRTPTGVVAAPARTAAAFPRPQHVVVVVMENHSYSDVIGNTAAPYLNSLARHGRSLTRMYATTHPSEPNYLRLFAGGTVGVSDDSCPHYFGASNLGHELLAARRTFVGYSEGLPRAGSRVCNAGSYARRHAPWVNFTDLPSRVNQPFSAFPSNYYRLPTESFVVPDLAHDMHDGTVAQGDAWVSAHLGGYARWAATHHSLLIVTWDEDDSSQANRIPTIVYGQGITAGGIGAHLTHDSLLRTLEDLYGLHRLGASARARAIPLG